MMTKWRCQRLRLWEIAIVITCMIVQGCTAAFYGVKPDPKDFYAESFKFCQEIHLGDSNSANRNACAEYEDSSRRARALENAYLTLERVNRWSLLVGTTLALASVGALTGLYAFGQAGSDAAKIIPIAGTFVGGVLAYMSSEVKADAYEDARHKMAKARAEAEKLILPGGQTGRDPSKYNAARSQLEDSISHIEATLTQEIRTARASPQELVRKAKELEKDNQLLAFVSKYTVKEAQPSGNRLTILFSETLQPADQKLLAENGTVRIEGTDIKLTGSNIAADSVSVDLPESIGTVSKPRGIAVRMGSYDLSPIRSVPLPPPHQ